MALNKRNPGDEWSRIVTELLQDLTDTSESEILKELLDEGLDPRAEAERIRRMAADAGKESGRRRLSRARAEANDYQTNQPARTIELSPEKARQIMAGLSASRRGERFTLAARKASELTDSDVQQFVQVLFGRGIIDSDGNFT